MLERLEAHYVWLALAATACSSSGEIALAGAADSSTLVTADASTDGPPFLDSSDSSIPDSSSSADSSTDAAPAADSAPPPPPSCSLSTCGGACCGDTCVPRSCASCSTGVTFCQAPTGNGTCGADCSTCAGHAIGCYACNPAPSGWCDTSASNCPGDFLTACPCPSGDSSECPGENQVCDGFRCWSCGQHGQGPPSTDGEKCKNGKICDQASSTCR